MKLTIDTETYPGIMFGFVLETKDNRITMALPFIMLSIKYESTKKDKYTL
tara:strand:+ start:515 stop:664 length:150 start_codon:yes stop_codon:yes gene_type:complete